MFPSTGGRKEVASKIPSVIKNDHSSGTLINKSNDHGTGRGLFIYGKRWYFRLVYSQDSIGTGKKKSRALMQDYTLNDLSKKLIICFTPMKIPGSTWTPPAVDPITQKKFDGYKLFAVFDNYLELLPYINKFKESDRSFYEIIFGEFPQKPHFDIDIAKDTLNKEQVGRDVISALLTAIEATFTSLNLRLDYARDILLYDSNKYDVSGFSANKISYHLIINNYYHNNNLEAKAFYEHIIKQIDPLLNDNFVDPKVYSNRQQFRIVGCQKVNSGRIKVFNEVITDPRSKKYTHIYSDADPDKELAIEEENSSNNENIKLLQIIYESLITNVYGFTHVPSFYEEKKYDFNQDEIEITEELRDKALTLMKEKLALEGAPFKILSIENNKINLKRLQPSMCPICKRVHEAENPVIYVNHSRILWSCRRANSSLLLGYREIYSYDDFVSEKILHPNPEKDVEDLLREEGPIFSLDAFGKKKISPEIHKSDEKEKISPQKKSSSDSGGKTVEFPLKIKPVEKVVQKQQNNVEQVMKDMTKYKNQKYDNKYNNDTMDSNITSRLKFNKSRSMTSNTTELDFSQSKNITSNRSDLLQFD